MRDMVVCVQICPVQSSQTFWTMWPRECPVETTEIGGHPNVRLTVRTMQGGGVRDKVVCVQLKRPTFCHF